MEKKTMRRIIVTFCVCLILFLPSTYNWVTFNLQYQDKFRISHTYVNLEASDVDLGSALNFYPTNFLTSTQYRFLDPGEIYWQFFSNQTTGLRISQLEAEINQAEGGVGFGYQAKFLKCTYTLIEFENYSLTYRDFQGKIELEEYSQNNEDSALYVHPGIFEVKPEYSGDFPELEVKFFAQGQNISSVIEVSYHFDWHEIYPFLIIGNGGSKYVKQWFFFDMDGDIIMMELFNFANIVS